ncbi:hypothetical protein J41TS12_38820 [Paenibacillus antibioticophila]|uniref:Ni2+-binding GTPase n=1 Tax=Paenibacillus antibioticophila TaxID=1274374 RepID=A0A919XTK2_9BACL|nr:hypothetical protein [Paenibacillus antibioticophila]GIO39021.1 hypothetical protein J41TS12_38820 [Paenibacillus antibioticophila]
MQQGELSQGTEERDQGLLQLLELPGLHEEDRLKIQALLEQLTALQAENARLRKRIHRLSAGNTPKMSTKLKEALYE